MIVINPKSNTPLYEQVSIRFKELIIKEALKSGDKIPSIRELACILMINPNTISKAYISLEQENIFETIRGSGAFVKDDAKEIVYEGFKEKIKKEARILVKDSKIFHLDYTTVLQYINEAYYDLEGDYNDRN